MPYVVTPPAVGLSLKQAFANAVIALSGDPRDCIDMEALVTGGYLTVDQVAAYVNAIGTADFWAGVIMAWPTTSFCASVLNSASITVARCASIMSSANLSASKGSAIFTHANLLADRTQSILYAMTFSAQLAGILAYGAGDLTVVADTAIGGVNRYGTLTVASGKTLTITGQPGALIANKISNAGTIAKSKTGGAGGGGCGGGGAGGAGGGGLVVFASYLVNTGTISAAGDNGVNASGVPSYCEDTDGGAGIFCRVGADVAGLGGDGAYYSGWGGAGLGKRNGGGGGGGARGFVYGACYGGDSTTTDFATYATLATRIQQAVVDWVIVNVFLKAPTTTKSIPNGYGSGGGGGSAGTTLGGGGGGGGGGGNFLGLYANFNNPGTVQANGSFAGNGDAGGIYDNEGGGGGGGVLYVLYKTLVAAGTVQASGGTKGIGDSNDTAGVNGTAGVATAQAV